MFRHISAVFRPSTVCVYDMHLECTHEQQAAHCMSHPHVMQHSKWNMQAEASSTTLVTIYQNHTAIILQDYKTVISGACLLFENKCLLFYWRRHWHLSELTISVHFSSQNNPPQKVYENENQISHMVTNHDILPWYGNSSWYCWYSSWSPLSSPCRLCTGSSLSSSSSSRSISSYRTNGGKTPVGQEVLGRSEHHAKRENC